MSIMKWFGPGDNLINSALDKGCDLMYKEEYLV